MNDYKEAKNSKSKDVIETTFIDKPGRSSLTVSGIQGEVHQLEKLKEERQSLKNIRAAVLNFNQDYDRHLHLVEASSDAERKLDELAEKFSVPSDEVFERLMKISIRHAAVQKELAADLFLDGEATEQEVESVLEESQIDNLKIARE